MIESKARRSGLYTPDQEQYYGNYLSAGDRASLAAAQKDKAVKDLAGKQTNVSKIQEDPLLRDAQMRALGRYEDIAANRGMDAQARANIKNIELQNAGMLNQQQQGLASRMRRAGGSITGGQGLALANQNIQGAANRQSDASYDVAAEMERRYMDSIGRAAQLGGGVRAQDFGVASEKASSQDQYDQMVQSLILQGYDEQRANALAQQQMILQGVGMGVNSLGQIGSAVIPGLIK